MKALTKVAFTFLALLLMNMGCDKQHESINLNRCIRATVVYRICESVAVVQVHNASIGTSWTGAGTTYPNAIGVNLPLNIQKDSTVSFTLVKERNTYQESCNSESCAYNMNISFPEKLFCVTNISADKCSANDEK